MNIKQFFNSKSSNNQAIPISNDELTHITQEMYKKNLELTERNKTLSILREIDQIILSAVTNLNQIADKVTNILVTEIGLKLASVCLLNEDKKILNRIGLAESESVLKSKKELGKEIDYESGVIRSFHLNGNHNLLVETITTGKITISDNLKDIQFYLLTDDKLNILQKSAEIKSFIVFPLIVRTKIIGTMTLGLSEEEKDLSDYNRDLLNRLTNVIAIAIDNATLYTQLNDANEKLKNLDKLKDEFVSLASHELRTPMTAIKSYLWMAINGKGGPLTEKQKFYLNRSYDSTERLIKLVNEMLNVSRIEAGRIILQPQSISIKKLIDETLLELEPRSAELGINITASYTDNLPNVLADEDKVKQVLINLIGNSFKFTPKDGKITLNVSQKDLMIEIQVSDTGLGITKEDLTKLFQKFSMVSNNLLTKSNSQGTGLGLYISRSIIQLHGGDMWAESEGLGKGTTFTFTLKTAA